ncbi:MULTISPECIES: sensor histidine kinase [unclassified Paenibacillus]|uniref:cache domain-containing sensor histidine kinase n=1 Tax=unclassified Paenibacillus TaxID=185978 RepID=UPI000956C0B6|nr:MULTISPECIES: sensor histidine kinase [unclassified Paenibacillus]ASS64727.1 sensor histidine kinase [Paenibacillus sp. RUD330]SIR09020.1 HAMP domain-containing protein [Paenibacillus sp. RU4X]SIR27376.1 HAMP domain-containing protein [Paenibacillus sp. RU4T]
MNLRPKLLLAFILLIVVPVASSGVVSFLYYEHLLEKKYNEQTEMTMHAVGSNIRNFFDEMNRLTDASLTSSVVQETLKLNADPNGGASSLIAKGQAEKEMGELLFQNPAMSYIILYANNGALFRSTRNDPTTFKPVTYERLKSHPSYAKAERLNAKPLWIGPYEQEELTGKEYSLFTQMRVVKDRDSLDNLGIMVTQFKSSGVDDILTNFRGSLSDGSRYYIVNQRGLVLLDSETKLAGQVLDGKSYLPSSAEQPYASERAKFQGVDSLTSSYWLGINDWMLVSAKPWNSLMSENVNFVKWISLITGLCLLSAILFNVFFVNRVAKSIIRVVRKMRLVEQGLLDIRVPVQGKDETVLLGSSFNSMTERLGGLLTEVREEQVRKQRAEMMLMQAQIKPHFLFNTLESINALAAQNEGAKIMLMVHRLSRLLRTSMHHKEEITVHEELEHVRSYLEIQKYRFEDLFHYELDVDEEALEYRILKLTLQPLVENSIQHGFDGLEHAGMIRVSVSIVSGSIVLEVADNGIGMDGEAMGRIAEGRKEEKWSPMEDGERGGLGLRNVADRLRIHYGPGYGMMICSSPGQGTTIRCTIPRNRGEQA